MSSPAIQPSAARNFCLYHLPAIVFAVVILTVSVIPNLHTPPLRTLALDKVAHFVEFAVFAFLVFRSMSRLPWAANSMRAFLLSTALLTVFAAASELIQHFVPGRHLDARDLMSDMVGGLLVLAFLEVRRRRRPPSDSRADNPL